MSQKKVVASVLLHVVVMALLQARNCARMQLNVTTADELVLALRQFAATGADTDVFLLRNITFAGVNKTGWPITNLSRGTLTIQPHPILEQLRIPTVLDLGMERGLTEPPTGTCYMELRNLQLMNMCFHKMPRGYNLISSTGVLFLGRTRWGIDLQ